MNKKLVAPFIIWIMFLVVDIASLVKGINQQETLRIAASAIALLVASAFIFIIMRNTAKELKAVRVRR